MAGASTSGTGRRRLGRGLGSLIAAVSPAPLSHETIAVDGPADGNRATNISSSEQATDPSTPTVVQVPVAAIVPNRRQPRQDFDDGSIASLAESIRKAGLMQPIVVRPIDGDASGKAGYELIAGERRWRAARQLSMNSIPAIVRSVDDRTAAEWALIENLQREDLNPMDRAAAFARLIDDFGMSHQEIADEVGLDRSTISNLLRLNDLDTTTANAVRTGHLSLGHAKALLGCTDGPSRASLAHAAVRNGWSVRKTEGEVRRFSSDTSHNPSRTAAHAAKSGSSAHLGKLEERLGELLGTRVRIERGKEKGAGRLVIEYYSIEQFEGLLERANLAEALASTSA